MSDEPDAHGGECRPAAGAVPEAGADAGRAAPSGDASRRRRSHLDDADRRYEDLNGLVVGLVRQGQRLDRRLSELRDELELAVKAELSGRLGMLQVELGHRFDDLATRIAALEGGDPRRGPESPDH